MRMRSAVLLVAVVLLGGLGLLRLLADDESGLGDVPGVPGGIAGEIEAGEGAEEGGALSPVGDWLFARRSARDAARSARAYERAVRQAAIVRAETREAAPALAASTWSHVGPKSIGARVADVAVDPTRADTVYAAAASGGVWKSTDGGLTWTPSWPAANTQAMGALATGSDGRIYAGTGEPTPAGGFVVSAGTGVYLSDDGGTTWTPMGLEDSGSVGRIAVDPRAPERVFVAAAGDLLSPGGERGLYRSTDGGISWELVLSGENPTTGAIDVAVDPRDPRNVLAATWDRDVPGGKLTGSGSGLHLSTDGGDTWKEARLPGNVRQEQVGRIGVAFAPSDPRRAYAVVANDRSGEGVGLWRSDDGGRTWAKTSAPVDSLAQSNYGWWFGRIWVDPRDEERLFVGGVPVTESTDGGDSFTVQGSGGGPGLPVGSQVVVATNQHAMVWDPSRPGRVYLGNDGGMYRSGGGGHSGTWVNARSQGWTQHYSVSGSSWTASTSPPAETAEPTEENPLGTITAVDTARSDPDVIYVGTVDGHLWRTTDQGESWTPLEDADGKDDLPAAWVTHMTVDPEDADVVYAVFSGPSGVSHLVQTGDGGDAWTDIGGNLPDAPVNDAVVLPGARLAVGTDVGVFLRQGSSWLSVGSNLPAVPVLDVRYQGDTNTITAATFGHGIQRVTLP